MGDTLLIGARTVRLSSWLIGLGKRLRRQLDGDKLGSGEGGVSCFFEGKLVAVQGIVNLMMHYNYAVPFLDSILLLVKPSTIDLRTMPRPMFLQQVKQAAQLDISRILEQSALSSQELLELTQNQSAFETVLQNLIATAQKSIQQSSVQEGLAYLARGEKILEYAASCRKNIDRRLILSVLHNEAYGYQRLWKMEECSNYLEALIFNLEDKLEASTKPRQFNPNQKQNPVRAVSPQEPAKYLPTSIPSPSNYLDRLKLSKYYLQYSATSSQMRNHKKAAESSCSALRLLQQPFEQTLSSLKTSTSLTLPRVQQLDVVNLIDANISQASFSPRLTHFASYTQIARSLQAIWTSRMLKGVSDSLGFMRRAEEDLKGFTIGTIMQIKPYSQELGIKMVRRSNHDYTIESGQINVSETSYLTKIHQVLYICASLFTLSTEMRLQSCLGLDNWRATPKKQDSSTLKEAQLYHLMALIFYFLHIPFKLSFLDHLLASYSKCYGSFAQGEAGSLTDMDEQILNNLDKNQIRNFDWTNNSISGNQNIGSTPITISNLKRLKYQCKRLIAERYSENSQKSNQEKKKSLNTINTSKTHRREKSSSRLSLGIISKRQITDVQQNGRQSQRKPQLHKKSKSNQKSKGKLKRGNKKQVISSNKNKKDPVQVTVKWARPCPLSEVNPKKKSVDKNSHRKILCQYGL